VSWLARHDERLRRAAFHEAGHAVVARALGLTVEAASIREDRTTAGRVRFRVGGDRRSAEREIVVLLSGGVAEKLATGAADADGAASDVAAAWELLLSMASSEERAKEWMAAAWRAAEKLVTENWSSVIQLAEALLARRSVA